MSEQEAKLEGNADELNSTGFNTTSTNQPPEDDEDDEPTGGKQQKERRKIEIKFIQDKSRRHITFSKRKAGIMKKAYELSVLTGTQVLLLVVSETGLVYTFTTPKLQPLVTKSEGKNLIQACLNAPEEGLDDDQENGSDDNSPESAGSPGQQQQQQQQQQLAQQQQQQQPTTAIPQPHQQPPNLQPGHLPPGMPYGNNHPMPLPPQGYHDNSVYQQYFSNMSNGVPNQQQYQ